MNQFNQRYPSGKLFQSSLPIPISGKDKTLIITVSDNPSYLTDLLKSKLLKTIRPRLVNATKMIRLDIQGLTANEPSWGYQDSLVLKKSKLVSRTRNDLTIGHETTIIDLGPYITRLMDFREGRILTDKFYEHDFNSIIKVIPDVSEFENVLVFIPIANPVHVVSKTTPCKSFTEAFFRHLVQDKKIGFTVQETETPPVISYVVTNPEITFISRFDPLDNRSNTPQRCQTILNSMARFFQGNADLSPEELTDIGVSPDSNKAKSAISTLDRSTATAAAKLIKDHKISDKETASEVVQQVQSISIDNKKSIGDLDISDSPELMELLQSVNTPQTFADAKRTKLKSQAIDRSAKAVITLYGAKPVMLADIDTTKGDTPVNPMKLQQTFLNPEMAKNTSIASSMSYLKTGEHLRDFARVIKSLSEDPDTPMFVTDVQIEDASDSLSFKDNFRLTFRDSNDKSHTLNIDVPKPTDDGYYLLNGSKWSITKQIIAFPVIKTKPNQVLLTTSYNKATITRFGQNVSPISHSIRVLLKQASEKEVGNPKVKITTGDVVKDNIDFAMDPLFRDICSNYSKLQFGNVNFNFNRVEMENIINDEASDKQKQVLDKHTDVDSQPCGVVYNGKKLYSIIVLQPNSELSIINSRGDVAKFNGAINDFILERLNDNRKEDSPEYSLVGSSGRKFNFTRIKLLKRNLPLILVVGFAEGLVNVLKRYKTKFAIISPEKYRTLSSDDKRNKDFIKFKDGYILYETQNIRDILLLNGMKQLPTEEYSLADYETQGKGWVDYISDITGSVGYVKGLKNFQYSFIDPISKDILAEMGIDNDFVGLMLYANTMLENDQFKEASDMSNYRIRGYEMVNGVLYKLLHKQMEVVRATKDSALPQKFSISPKAVVTELVTTSNVEELQALNPLVESEMRNKVTWVGFGALGDGEMVTRQMRAFHPSMKGIFGYFSPDSNKTGVNRTLSSNTAIKTVRGYLGQYDESQPTDATKLLAINELLNPFASVHSDPPKDSWAIVNYNENLSNCWKTL